MDIDSNLALTLPVIYKNNNVLPRSWNVSPGSPLTWPSLSHLYPKSWETSIQYIKLFSCPENQPPTRRLLSDKLSRNATNTTDHCIAPSQIIKLNSTTSIAFSTVTSSAYLVLPRKLLYWDNESCVRAANYLNRLCASVVRQGFVSLWSLAHDLVNYVIYHLLSQLRTVAGPSLGIDFEKVLSLTLTTPMAPLYSPSSEDMCSLISIMCHQQRRNHSYCDDQDQDTMIYLPCFQNYRWWTGRICVIGLHFPSSIIFPDDSIKPDTSSRIGKAAVVMKIVSRNIWNIRGIFRQTLHRALVSSGFFYTAPKQEHLKLFKHVRNPQTSWTYPEARYEVLKHCSWITFSLTQSAWQDQVAALDADS